MQISVMHSCATTTISYLSKQRTNIVGAQDDPNGKFQKLPVKLFKYLAPPLVAAVFALSPIWNLPAQVALGKTIDAQKGGTLFRRACIGCHDAGGNIIQPGATLFLKDLQRALVRIARLGVSAHLDHGYKKRKLNC